MNTSQNHEVLRKESAIATAVDKEQYEQSRFRKQLQQLSHLMYEKLHQTDEGVNLFYLSPQQPLSIKDLIFINADLEVTIYQK